MKNVRLRQKKISYLTMLKQFKEKAKKLLDIVECKCDFAKCKFDKLIRVSAQEQVFLTDQKNLRRLYIVSIDVLATSRLKRKLTRNVKESSPKSSHPMCTLSLQITSQTSGSEILSSESDNGSTGTCQIRTCIGTVASSSSAIATSKKRVPLPMLSTVSG